MTEHEETIAHTPITISIDVDQLLRSELGWRTVNVGSYDDPEEDYVPDNDRIIDVVADKLASALKRETENAVRSAVREKVLEKVDGLIDEVMSTPITLTSTYGEPKSPEMSMREAMIKAMTDRLDEKVNSDGKRSSDSFGRGTQTYLQWRAEQTARAVLDKELSQRMTDAAKQIKSTAMDLVSKKIAEVLGRGF